MIQPYLLQSNIQPAMDCNFLFFENFNCFWAHPPSKKKIVYSLLGQTIKDAAARYFISIAKFAKEIIQFWYFTDSVIKLTPELFVFSN